MIIYYQKREIHTMECINSETTIKKIKINESTENRNRKQKRRRFEQNISKEIKQEMLVTAVTSPVQFVKNGTGAINNDRMRKRNKTNRYGVRESAVNKDFFFESNEVEIPSTSSNEIDNIISK